MTTAPRVLPRPVGGTDRPQRDAASLLGLLAEPQRLRVVAAVALGAASSGQVAQACGLDLRIAWRLLSRLEAGGVLVRSGEQWSVATERLAAAARADAARPRDEGAGAPDAVSAGVLRAFLTEGRLSAIPVVRSKRVVVLDHVARVFEIGRRYDEREVDVALRAFYADYAALRRHLVDEGFLSRSAGVYWRTGGSVDVDAG